MDTGFFAKVDSGTTASSLDADTLEKLKLLLKQHPELVNDLL